ncbi:MAG: hypothetical protein KKA73_07780 [Chloroflexi bacterium]|nr:hypothetical protein [Chloroflexota bacterium]MBU1747572.1 hypothetical protein [Chloroflexota bacterium]MBU1878316.1 hypothetical protein [Chloroflexota bacterium]
MTVPATDPPAPASPTAPTDPAPAPAAPATRVYHYDGREWPITDPAFTHDAVIAHMQELFAELAGSPEIRQETAADGIVHYHLRKRAGTKG